MNRKALILFLLCLVCIALGIIVGSLIKWDKGNAAILGAVAGFLLFTLMSWLLSFRKKGQSSESHELQRPGIGTKQPIDAVAKKVRREMEQEQAHITRTPLFH